MLPIRVGSYVTHSQRPAWGLGKVFGQNSTHVLVGFVDLPEQERFKRLEWRVGLLDRATINGDAQLDSWNVQVDSTCHYVNAVAKPKRHGKVIRWTRLDAMERFVNKFSGGFADAWYRSSSRADHVTRHTEWTESLGGNRLRQFAETDPIAGGQVILTVLSSINKGLLQPSEFSRLESALNNHHQLSGFLIALADLLDAERPSAELFDRYVAAFAALELTPRKRPLPWPVVTALPFIAQPSRFLMVRAKFVRQAATGMGFELNFQEKPNARTYLSILAFADDLLAFSKERGGADMIDVLALIHAVGE